MNPYPETPMNPIRRTALAATALVATAFAIGLFAAEAAQAEPFAVTRSAAGSGGARAGQQAWGLSGAYGAAGVRRGAVADGQGNAAGRSVAGFDTANGQGLRTRSFERHADGSAKAGSDARIEGTRGSAERHADYARTSDGSATASRTTSATNAGTGMTVDASSTWTKGSGASRSVSCTDASGKSVDCRPR